ncbi:hypothetical protein [uncultured Dialister sp.]|uniref:hypothetical protein n=1 Tax=uncultured Dialister sp. TaxID=278064 RepID=UPI0026010B97|nr:hypothetical protein [uncultured Dialister sp.]
MKRRDTGSTRSPPHECLNNPHRHLGQGNEIHRYRRLQAVLYFVAVIEIHGERNGRAMDTGDEDTHAHHAPEHLGLEMVRHHADGRKDIAINNDQHRRQHHDPENEFSLVPPLG